MPSIQPLQLYHLIVCPRSLARAPASADRPLSGISRARWCARRGVKTRRNDAPSAFRARAAAAARR